MTYKEFLNRYKSEYNQQEDKEKSDAPPILDEALLDKTIEKKRIMDFLEKQRN